MRTAAGRAPDATGNLLLDALPPGERESLLAGASHDRMPIRTVLFEPDDAVARAYFPLGGVVSLVTVMLDGGMVEMATVGREGVVGVPTILNPGLRAGARGISQVDGEALSVTAETFRDQFRAGGKLAAFTNSFTQALLTLAGRNAACNRRHTMSQRCARWLLMTHDRVGADEFGLTQEFLAQMLGSRRPSVTQAAAGLQEAGAIAYRRGNITVLDRRALEAGSCECYEAIQEVFDVLYLRG